jgi:hypothetical protein
MNRIGPVARMGQAGVAAMAGLLLAVAPVLPARAQQPPRKDCVAVTKAEYDNARRKRLLRNRYGTYVRTGPILRRRYWYCTN